MARIAFEAIAKLPAGKDGKTRWDRCGVVFESDKGLSLKLDHLPVAGFDGWLSLREPRAKDAPRTAPATAPAGNTDPNDDIPF